MPVGCSQNNESFSSCSVNFQYFLKRLKPQFRRAYLYYFTWKLTDWKTTLHITIMSQSVLSYLKNVLILLQNQIMILLTFLWMVKFFSKKKRHESQSYVHVDSISFQYFLLYNKGYEPQFPICKVRIWTLA